MKCPVCKSELVRGEDKEFETSSEHVCNPNQNSYPLRPTWECLNNKCELSGYDCFWNEYGELYSNIPYSKKINWINDNEAPFGTFSRKINVEIYGKGLKKKIYLSPALCLWFLQPMIEFKYLSNEDGDVLGKKMNLIFLKKSNGSYSIHWNSWYNSLKYYFKSFKRIRKNWNKKHSSFLRKELKEKFQKREYNLTIPYKIFNWYINTFYSKLKKLLYYISDEDINIIKKVLLELYKKDFKKFTEKDLIKVIQKCSTHDIDNTKKIISILDKQNFIFEEGNNFCNKWQINKVEIRKYKLNNLK